MWPLSIVFAESLVAQHYSHRHFLAWLELLRWLNFICLDIGILTFGCAVRFNPWYVDFISGPSSYDQPLSSWLIFEHVPLLWVKIGLIRNLLFVAYSILLGCYVIFHGKPSTLVILCGLCSWKNIQGVHGWHSILKYKCCTACANIVHTSKLIMYKPDEPGVFEILWYVQCTSCGGQYPQPTSLVKGSQAQHSAFLLVLVN